MGRTELGRVIDKEALASSDGARGLFRVQIPARWATSGSEIALALPSRVECARCSGGGCDRCGRSGALKTPSDPAARSLRLTIPAGSAAGVALRVVRPFGDLVEIEQMIIEVRCGEAPSVCVSRIQVRRRRDRAPRVEAQAALRPGDAMSLLAAITMVVAAIAGLLASR